MESNATYVLAYDIGGTHIRISLVSDRNIIETKVFTWPEKNTYMEELQYMIEIGYEIAIKHKVINKLGAIGISLAANLDENGIVTRWPNRVGWEGHEFKSFFEKHFSIPVIVDDDANIAALAEIRYGGLESYRNILVITVGTGIGSGVILNGTPYKGKEGCAGEIGHFVVVPDGASCSCGKRGCLQAMASGRYLEYIAKENGVQGVKGLLLACKSNEQWAKDALTLSGFWIGLTTANIVNLLNLECAVIAGRLCYEESLWWDKVQETFYKNVRNFDKCMPEIRKARFNKCGSLLGAASSAFDVLGNSDIEFELIDNFIENFENSN